MTINKIIILFLIISFTTRQNLLSQDNGKQLSLDSCIKIAINNNVELKADAKNIEIASKQYEIQKSALFPVVDFSSDYKITDQYDNLNKYSSFSAGIQVYQPIWQNDKISTEVKQSRLNSEASEIEFLISRSDIIYYLTVDYINLLRNNKIAELITEMLKQFSITVDAARERFQAGLSKRTDVLKAETEYSNMQYVAIQLKTAVKLAEQNLLKAMDLQSENSITTIDFLSDEYPELEISITDSLFQLANTYLPELKLIQRRIELQELSVVIEKKNRFPEIGAFANYNWIDNQLYSNELYGAVGISLRVNIFNGNRKKNVIALEKVKLQQLNFQKEDLVLSIINEIQKAQLGLFEASEKIKNAEMRVQSSKETLELTREEYKQGLSSMLELIQAQYTNFESNQNLVNALAEYQLAATLLKRKTGLLLMQYAD